jgi:L-alanine-DL-glutamate epimerase-like enolase superfamily enzyme
MGEKALLESLIGFPSIQFGLETAFRSLAADNPFVPFPSAFTRGKKDISINGLVWMGDPAFMRSQIEEKISAGFRCIKLKIGALDFAEELRMLESIRHRFDKREIEIRVDANGAFSPDDAMSKLDRLSAFGLHSIEQPIAPGQNDAMALLCAESPIPVALDESLIGVFSEEGKRAIVRDIRPQYLILKPSLIGGFHGAQSWITLAEEYNIGWWATSALESNVGLNAIAQWTFLQHNPMPQGLGTGALYTNNIGSPLTVASGALHYHNKKSWEFEFAPNQ